MCGILGYLNFSKEKLPSKIFNEMLSTLGSRGPDNKDVYENDCLQLGHTRLAIIDLNEKANQPMKDNCNENIIVFNGCIYNYRELKKSLIQRGEKFRTNSDTEVILKAYNTWNEDCTKYLDGDFAFAIWNKKKNELFLARDRFGVKPLYFSYEKKTLVFSSSIQAFKKIGNFDFTLSPESLHYHFSLHSSVPSPHTIFSKIHKLEPGHWMKVSKNNFQIKKFWSLKKYNESELITSEDEAVPLIYENLENAIKKRVLASDKEIGILLSGGLDSSLIVALAKKYNENIKTFSIGFEDEGEEKGNEFFYSDKVVNAYKTSHKKIMVPNTIALDNISNAFLNMPEPMFAQDAIAFFMLAKEVSKDVKVVLSGQGADEVFAGYFWYPKIANEEFSTKNFLKHYVDRDHREIETLLNINIIDDYTYNFIDENLKPNLKRSFLNSVLNLDITKLIVDDPVKRVDSMTMSHGLEARVPFLDYRLIETANKIHPNIHLQNNGKNILKIIAKDYFPKSFINREKGYFPMPALKYIKGKYYDFVYDILNSLSCKNRGLFNRNYVDNLLKSPNSNLTAIKGNKLWHLAATEYWLQKNID